MSLTRVLGLAEKHGGIILEQLKSWVLHDWKELDYMDEDYYKSVIKVFAS